MNAIRLLHLLITFFCMGASLTQAQDKSYSWISPPSRAQLERDPSLIPKGKGFLCTRNVQFPKRTELPRISG